MRIGRRFFERQANPHGTVGAALALAFVLSWAGPARAELTGTSFVFEGIEGMSGLSLDDRLGVTNGSVDHVINIEDCEAYKGGRVKIRWSVNPTLVDADYAVKRAIPGQTCGGDETAELGSTDPTSCPDILAGPSDLGSRHEFELDMDDILDLDPDTPGVDCLAGDEFISRLYVIVEYLDDSLENETIEFTVDLDPPAAPMDVAALPGENSVRVSWEDDANTEGDVEYRVYYRASAPIVAVEDADGSVRSGTDASSLTITGLQTNVLYYFRVVAIDQNDNESELSEGLNVFATTIPATDFWEHYKESGGAAEGGFCFVATAAYGSGLAPHVQWLRRLRDEMLMPTEAGRAFVSWYYENSPRLALSIQHHPWLAAITRLALVPLVFVAWFLVGLGLPAKLALLTGLWLSWRLARAAVGRRFATGAPVMRRLATPAGPTGRFRVRGLGKLGLALVAGAMSLGLAAAPARAGLQVDDLFSGESPRHLLIELKFGPYKPNIDKEFKGAKPYEDIFGAESFLLSVLQVEYEFFQDWGVASAGVGIGFGTTSGKSIMAGGGGGIESTSLYLLPLNVSLTYHLDAMARYWSVPLVPFVRAGFDYVVWWTTSGQGHLSDWKAQASDSASVGYGGEWGWHVSGGIKILLDIFAPTMARTFDIEMGVNNSYLFAEYMYLRADNFGARDGLRVGAGTFLFGLAFEI